MNEKNVQILGCKIGKTIIVEYYNKSDGRNYTVEDDEIAHPDMKEALLDFKQEMAQAFYSLNKEVVDSFTPTGFAVSDVKEKFFLDIKGKFSTSHKDTINVSSGKIELKENSPVSKKLLKLRRELFLYFFEGKCAQQKIPFEEKDGKKKDEKKK